MGTDNQMINHIFMIKVYYPNMDALVLCTNNNNNKKGLKLQGTVLLLFC